VEKFIFPFTVAVLMTASAAAQTIESAYTDFDAKKCRHTPGKAEEDYGEWRCAGYDGIPIRMWAGDQRITISYGPRAMRELAARQTLSAFNGEGSKIEWRIETDQSGHRKPFATIMRWSTATLDDKQDQIKGQVLVVTRLGSAGVCHVGYVDGRANPNANELAREIADKHARDFVCRKDKAIVIGEKGSGFSSATEWEE
jgi:hypothetical protein